MYTGFPLCFERATSLQEEISPLSPSPHHAVLGVISDDRVCSNYTPWHQGFTPKEHREMIDRQWERNWQLEREREDRKWREHQERKADERHRVNLLINTGLVTVVMVVAIIVSALIARGIIP